MRPGSKEHESGPFSIGSVGEIGESAPNLKQMRGPLSLWGELMLSSSFKGLSLSNSTLKSSSLLGLGL